MWAGGSQTEGSDAFAAPNARSEEGANACASGSSDTSSAASASDMGRRYEDIPRCSFFVALDANTADARSFKATTACSFNWEQK